MGNYQPLLYRRPSIWSSKVRNENIYIYFMSILNERLVTHMTHHGHMATTAQRLNNTDLPTLLATTHAH